MPYNAPRSNRYPLSSYPGNEKEWRMRMWAYLAGTSMGLWNIDDLENLGPTVLNDSDSAHLVSPA